MLRSNLAMLRFLQKIFPVPFRLFNDYKSFYQGSGSVVPENGFATGSFECSIDILAETTFGVVAN